MILCDTGGLLFLADGKSVDYQRITDLIATRKQTLITTEPCMTEAMYLAGARVGWEMQRRVLDLVNLRTLLVRSIVVAEWRPLTDLMAKYKDLPMDFADASLVVLSERERTNDIITIDSDFLIYRRLDGSAFNIINQIE